MKKLTSQEFIEKYGEAKVVFTYYYKYSFSFKGDFNGKSILIIVGGISDEIYRFTVEGDKEYYVKDLDMNYAEVKEGETVIANFSEY